MCSKRLILICYVLLSVESQEENTRNKREGRFFSFNTLDEDITVHLDFSVPFLSIPVRRTMDSTLGAMGLPMININPASLALGGAVVLGTTVLVPLLFKGYTEHYAQKRYSRILDSAEFGADNIINFATKMLADNRSVGGCALRIACWTAQNSGDVTNVNKIMSPHNCLFLLCFDDGVVEPYCNLIQVAFKWAGSTGEVPQPCRSNKLLSSIINSTSVEDAMLSGKHGRDCTSYGPCPLTEDHIPALINNVLALGS